MNQSTIGSIYAPGPTFRMNRSMGPNLHGQDAGWEEASLAASVAAPCAPPAARPRLLGNVANMAPQPWSSVWMGSKDSLPLQHPTQLPYTSFASDEVLRDLTNTLPGSKKPIAFHREAGVPLLPAAPMPQPQAGARVSLFGELFGDTEDASAAPDEYTEDPQQVAEYVADISNVLHSGEGKYKVQPDYMDRQPEISARMRTSVLDSLVELHSKHKCQPETFFLMVSLIDRFLEKRVISRHFLKLVGVSALFIAAKFEEVSPPPLRRLVRDMDRAYSKQDIMRMEVSILTALDFEICSPTPLPFVQSLQRINGCDEAHVDLVLYLLELAVIDYKLIKYSPSHLAAGVVLTSNKLLRRTVSWTSDLAIATGLTQNGLRDCMVDIFGLLEIAESSALRTVREKYSQPLHHEVAKVAFDARSALVEEYRLSGANWMYSV